MRLLTAVAALLTASGAVAQSASEPVIVVTGERRDRSEAATSSSVAVLTQRDIEASSADRIDQLLAYIPNVQVGSGGEGPTVRGQDTTGVLRDLPAFLGGTRPRATMQVDGRSIGYNEFVFGTAPAWDVAQIEVFRSPQTTTQGRNSIAGAIFVTTVDPTFAWEGRARALADNRGAYHLSSVVSGPLVEGEAAFRISVDGRRGEPSSVITTTAQGIDPNRDDYDQARLKLLVTPSAVPGLKLRASVSHMRAHAPQFEGVRNRFTDRTDPVATYGIFRTSVTALTMRAEQEFTPRLSANVTASMGWSSMRRFAPVGLGETRILGSDRSLEGIVNWQPAETVRLVGGVHWLGNELDQSIDVSAIRLGRGEFTDRQHSLGLFSELEWQPVPKLTATVGARYQRDRQDRVGVLGIGAAETPLAYRGRFAAFLPKLALAYDLGAVRVGALAQKAYNPGGTTINTGTLTADTFEAETLWAYELFARYAPEGGRWRINANLFHYDLHNTQRSLLREFQGPTGVLFFSDTANAPQARSRGAELQIVWRRRARLTIEGSVGLLDTLLSETLTPNDPLLGKEFQRSPHFTGLLAMRWRPIEALQLSAHIRRTAAYFSDDANTPERRIAPATTADMRAEWRTGSATLFGFARNLLDNFYLTYLFSPSSRLATAGDPRELGIGVDWRF